MMLFRTERLANGVTIEFFDQSNRYFGDYHRVCVEVRITVASPDDGHHGTTVSLPLEQRQTTRRLERMGVPGGEVEATRNQLTEDYWRHAGRYLEHADYPARFLAALVAAARRTRASSPR